MKLKTLARNLARAMAPVAVLAVGAMVSGCDAVSMRINGEEGKKLSELDLTGPAPTGLVLAGPDSVILSEGDKLAIAVEGDPAVTDKVRFTLKDGALGILREYPKGDAGGGSATIRVTMPAPGEVTLAGSGAIRAAGLARAAKITIAGSGAMENTALAGDTLELTIAGSGSYKAAGTLRDLSMTIAGSGGADMPGLKVDNARLTVAGSGNSRFASDGNVKAEIMGAGEVRVKGRATCKVEAMGSGRLVCEP
jgi:hypothetical protein